MSSSTGSNAVAVESSYSKAAGFVAVLCAILLFGSFGLWFKLQPIVRAQRDPVLFQLFFSLGVALTSILFLFNTSLNGWWIWQGFFVAVIWVPASTLSLFAVRLAGLSVATGIWGPGAIIFSFIWGAAAFDETIKSIPLTVLAFVMLFGGIIGVAWAGNDRWWARRTGGEEGARTIPEHAAGAEQRNFLVPKVSSRSDAAAAGAGQMDKPVGGVTVDVVSGYESLPLRQGVSRQLFFVGCFLAFALSVLSGSMLVPMHYYHGGKKIDILPSFGLGVFVTTAVIAVVVYIANVGTFRRSLQTLPPWKYMACALTSGTLWNAGNAASIVATEALGYTIGFPLTQLALLVTATWGMILFAEIPSRAAKVTFFMSACVVLGGAALLAVYG